MIEKAVLKSKVMTWVIRILAYVMMVAGICLFFSPITTILGFIPLVGGILKGVTGFFIFVGALLICIPLWFIAFSLAWLWYHPKVGAIFLAIGLVILGVILFINFKSTGSVETAAASAHITKHLLHSWIE